MVVISPLLDAAGPARGKATFGNNLKRNREKRTQNKQTTGRTVTKSVIWWKGASVSPQKRHSGGVSNLIWAGGKKSFKTNSTKNPTTGIPGDGVDDRKNEWHQWRPSASVESWSPGGFNSSLWFLSSDVKNEGEGTRRLRFSEQLGQRLMRPRDLWRLRQTLADQTNCFSPSRSCSASFLLFF